MFEFCKKIMDHVLKEHSKTLKYYQRDENINFDDKIDSGILEV